MRSSSGARYKRPAIRFNLAADYYFVCEKAGKYVLLHSHFVAAARRKMCLICSGV